MSETEGRGLNHSQHTAIFHPGHARPVTLIGAGGVGSMVAAALSRIGVRELEVWDDDVLVSHNLTGTLVYGLPDLGMKKVEALKQRLQTECDLEIHAQPRHWRPGDPLREAVIVCVDSMDMRQAIWKEVVKDRLIDILIDTRVAQNFICNYAVDPSNREDAAEYTNAVRYGTADAMPTTCGNHGIAYINGLAATVAVGMLTARWMHGEIPKRRFEFSMHEVREVQP